MTPRTHTTPRDPQGSFVISYSEIIMTEHITGRKRGPDKKPRKRRTDNPASYLPKTADAHRTARELGKRPGRPHGSRNGWTREERALEWELARAKARIEVAFYEATGALATGEALRVLYKAIDPDLWSRVAQMREHRQRRLEALRLTPSSGTAHSTL